MSETKSFYNNDVVSFLPGTTPIFSEGAEFVVQGLYRGEDLVDLVIDPQWSTRSMRGRRSEGIFIDHVPTEYLKLVRPSMYRQHGSGWSR
jgi:hypothetical protein